MNAPDPSDPAPGRPKHTQTHTQHVHTYVRAHAVKTRNKPAPAPSKVVKKLPKTSDSCRFHVVLELQILKIPGSPKVVNFHELSPI